MGCGILVSAGVASADIVRFWEGTQFRGKIVKKTKTEVVVQFDFGQVSFLPQEIQAVEAEPDEPTLPAVRPVETAAPAAAPPVGGAGTPRQESVYVVTPAAAQPAATLPYALRAAAFVYVVKKDGTKGAGSGIVINPHGTIVTNDHVIDGAEHILVMLPYKGSTSRFKDPKQYDATVLKADRYYDLALIDIQAETPEYLTFAPDNGLAVGEEVTAIGNPLGLAATVSRGIVSAFRTNRGLGIPYQPLPGDYINEREFEEITWIQTDASINPGNSGGPLLNSKYEIVGINTFGFQSAGGSVGLNFALHVTHVRKFAAGAVKKRSGRSRRH